RLQDLQRDEMTSPWAGTQGNLSLQPSHSNVSFPRCPARFCRARARGTQPLSLMTSTQHRVWTKCHSSPSTRDEISDRVPWMHLVRMPQDGQGGAITHGLMADKTSFLISRSIGYRISHIASAPKHHKNPNNSLTICTATFPTP